MRTSPPRSFDLEQRYPGLADWRRTAYRLHPRPGEPGVHDSSVGGPLLWPQGEDWPLCTADDHDDEIMWTVSDYRLQRLLVATRDQARARGEDASDVNAQWEEVLRRRKATVEQYREARPFIGLAQLYLRDVPSLRHPGGADLLQVLWCPHMHEDAEYLPRVRLVWRDSASITAIAPDPSPEVWSSDGHLVPEQCVVHPEELTEYPPTHCDGLELPPELADYDDWEALATGWKAGGWGDYCGVNGPVVPDCDCGAPTKAFFTVGSGEWGTEDGRGRPIEDAEFTPTPRYPEAWNPVQVYISRGYRYQLFQCVTGFDCPVTTRMT